MWGGWGDTVTLPPPDPCNTKLFQLQIVLLCIVCLGFKAWILMFLLFTNCDPLSFNSWIFKINTKIGNNQLFTFQKAAPTSTIGLCRVREYFVIDNKGCQLIIGLNVQTEKYFPVLHSENIRNFLSEFWLRREGILIMSVAIIVSWLLITRILYSSYLLHQHEPETFILWRTVIQSSSWDHLFLLQSTIHPPICQLYIMA